MKKGDIIGHEPLGIGEPLALARNATLQGGWAAHIPRSSSARPPAVEAVGPEVKDLQVGRPSRLCRMESGVGWPSRLH